MCKESFEKCMQVFILIKDNDPDKNCYYLLKKLSNDVKSQFDKSND